MHKQFHRYELLAYVCILCTFNQQYLMALFTFHYSTETDIIKVITELKISSHTNTIWILVLPYPTAALHTIIDDSIFI